MALQSRAMEFDIYFHEKEIPVTVADTILSQIRAVDSWALGAWGTYSIDKTADALYMRVKGPRFAGRVGVHYHYASDLYIVRTYQRNDATGEPEIIEEWKDVFAEDLVPMLDAVIG